MTHVPLVSVIIPTRDRPERLRIALASVLAQTYPAVEVIVVNDGGVDVSDVVTALDARRQVVEIRLPEHRERSAARNCGLRRARGIYIAYLDDDDWYDADHVATLVDTLERNHAAVAYTCARRVTEELRGDRWVPRDVDVPFRRFFDPAVLLMGNYIPILTLAHRRDCLDTTGLFDEGLTALEDWELCIRLSRHWPFVAIPRLTCNFTWRAPAGDAARARLLDFVRSTDIIYRRYAEVAATHPGVARAHAEFFRKLRKVRGPGLYTASVILHLEDHPLAPALAALAAVGAGLDHEVIVLTHHVSPDAIPLAPNVRILATKRGEGLASAANRAAVAAHGEHLVFLQSAALSPASALAPLVARLEADSQVPAGEAPALRLGTHTNGVSLVVRRSTFRALGGFDQRAATGREFQELCERLSADRCASGALRQHREETREEPALLAVPPV